MLWLKGKKGSNPVMSTASITSAGQHTMQQRRSHQALSSRTIHSTHSESLSHKYPVFC
jgi:hypothetical protein